MSDEIRVNGNLHSWGSIVARVNDERFYGFTAINYGDSRERVKGHGMGRHQAPRGRSRGKYDTEEVTLTGFKGSMAQLRQALADAEGTTTFGDIEFQIVVQYIEDDDTPITDELDRCVYTGTTASNEEGPDPLKEEIKIDCMLIRWNGLTLFDNSETNL